MSELDLGIHHQDEGPDLTLDEFILQEASGEKVSCHLAV